MEHGFFYHYCIHCYVQTSVRIVEASSYLCFAQVWNALARWFFTHGSNPHFSGSPETFKNVDIFVIECCESFFLMLLSLLNNHTGFKQVGASNKFSVVALVFAGHFLDVSHWVYIRCYLDRWLN